MIDTKTMNELQQELAELKTRARNANYKNATPRLPISNSKNHTSFEARMVGFTKRFNNWKHDLNKFENICREKPADIFVADNGMIVISTSDKTA